MKKSIILAEKPSVGRDLARVLGCFRREKGCIEGPRHIVTWAMGHLVELAEPASYSPAYKRWTLASLPMLPSPMKLQVIPRTREQFDLIASLLKRPDVSELIIATDAGREGELVARWIMKEAGWTGPVRRLWISSQTDKAVEDGFASLKDGREYENLYRAAECRAEADWIVGMNVTRALTCRHDTSLSAGRVQTPTLAIIAAREEEIEAFSGAWYWTLRGDFSGIRGSWKGSDGSRRFSTEEEAARTAEEVRGREAKVVSIERTPKREPSPLAYDLTELQRDAIIRLEFSAKKTLDVLQVLYERHKLVTYPRTDSRCISSDIVATLPGRLLALKDTPYGKHAVEVLRLNKPLDSRFVNDLKVTDHHAVIPTDQVPDLRALTADERKLYELVVNRFFEVLSPDCVYDSLKLVLEAGGHRFEASAREIRELGWKQISGGSGQDDDLEDEVSPLKLSGLKEGDVLQLTSAEVQRQVTRPPARYTEATLLSAMEHAGRFIEDASLKRSISGTGIGTPATRADIIEKLLSKYYIERDDRYLKPTAKGRELVKTAPPQLRSPELTAAWEQRLAAISEGLEESSRFSRDIREMAMELVEDIRTSSAVFAPDYKDAVKCPVCGGLMIHVQGKKKEKISACQSLSCGYEEIDGRPTRKARSMERSAVRKYDADRSEDSNTASFADFIKASEERRSRKRKR